MYNFQILLILRNGCILSHALSKNKQYDNHNKIYLILLIMCCRDLYTLQCRILVIIANALVNATKTTILTILTGGCFNR